MYFTRQSDLAVTLRAHVAMPSVFASDVVFDVQDQGGSWRLQERKVATPFEKDYDSAENPLEWLGLDTSTWVLFSAFELKVETQNTNFAACNVYRRHGFILRQVNRCAYPAYPDEVQLIWRKGLG